MRLGDLLLPSDPNVVWSIAYAIAGTGRPGHSALVVALPDGSPAILEAGTSDKAVVAFTPLQTWLCKYKGKVWIRRRKSPIAPDQSSRLTEFALLNDKKRYAELTKSGSK